MRLLPRRAEAGRGQTSKCVVADEIICSGFFLVPFPLSCGREKGARCFCISKCVVADEIICSGFALMRQQNGQFSMVDHMAGDAAHDQLAQAGMGIGPHDQQTGIFSLAQAQDRRADIVAAFWR